MKIIQDRPLSFAKITILILTGLAALLMSCKERVNTDHTSNTSGQQGDKTTTLNLAEGDQPVSPPMSPFSDSEQDLYTMSRNQLQRVPPADLIKEIEILEKRNENEKKELTSIANFNQILCQRLAKLRKECIAHLYITDDHGLDNLNCTNNDQKEQIPPPEIRVEVVAGGDNAYILLADSLYVSSEFTAGTSGAITFKRKDNKVIRPPRFRDLESLNIISIAPGSAEIIDGRLSYKKERIPTLSEGFGVRISVNGQQLMSDYELVKPDDPHDDWYYRINPNGILTLGRSPTCTVTLKEIRELQEQSKG